MPEPVATAQANTQPANTKTDVKPSDAPLLSAGTQTAPAVDPKAAPASDSKTQTEPVAKEGAESKDGENKDGKEVKAEGAPEKYDFKSPIEGVKLDEEAVSELSNVARELNLPNDKAQKFVDMAAKHTQKIESQMKEQQATAWAEARSKWVAELKADKEIGGANFEKSKELALRAVRFVGVPELKEVFDSGWGDHPALVKAFAKFGKAISEDNFVDPDRPSEMKSAAEVIYGKK